MAAMDGGREGDAKGVKTAEVRVTGAQNGERGDVMGFAKYGSMLCFIDMTRGHSANLLAAFGLTVSAWLGRVTALRHV